MRIINIEPEASEGGSRLGAILIRKKKETEEVLAFDLKITKRENS